MRKKKNYIIVKQCEGIYWLEDERGVCNDYGIINGNLISFKGRKIYDLDEDIKQQIRDNIDTLVENQTIITL